MAGHPSNELAKGVAADPDAEAARLLGLGPKLRELLQDFDPTGGAPAAEELPPGGFGRYRVIRLIGEGGMGSVFEAEQVNPRRRVALKVIKPGMDTKQVIARFEAEREALGRMDHPGIARVFDAGATDAGRPFFAMELVDGVPITEYCDAQKLTVRRRLELFIAVCRAVQHAHQKGVIHRDLKPSNVLVTLVDGEPVPKVIDFGIAKAIAGQRLSDQTVVTEVQQLVGTPEYMSPEQAGANGGDVDTRSDVYSLGALLYELLTGTTPFAHKQLRSLAYEEVRRIIREDEPPRPSARRNKSSLATGTMRAACTGRALDSARLCRTVRGELDWIVMRCLEKDRDRRYDTPNELAADLERHLRNEPVHAGPPTASYRLKKFARRHRAPLAAAAMMALLLIGGITGTTVGMLRARTAQSASAAAEGRARREADQVGELNEFLTEMFTAAVPDGEGSGRAVRVADLLERASKNLPQKFHGRPEAEIRARATVGRTYAQLGLTEPAIENFSKAYGLARKHLGEEDELTLEVAAKLTHWLVDGSPSPERLASGESLARSTHQTASRKLGRGHKITHLAALSCAMALHRKGSYAAAEQTYAEMLRVQREAPGADDIIGPSAAVHGLARLLREQGKLAQAEAMEREAVRLADVLEGNARSRVVTGRNLGVTLAAQDKLEDAAATYKQALESGVEELGYDFAPMERISVGYLDALTRMSKWDDALAFARQRLDRAAAAKPRSDAVVADRTAEVAELLSLAGRHEEALRTFEQAIAVRRAASSTPNYFAWRNRVLQALLGSHEPWQSEAVRAQVWCALDEALADQPTRTLTLDRDALQNSWFKLFRWNGRPHAPPAEQTTLVKEGRLADLRALPGPSEGLYLLAMDVTVEPAPLRTVNWFLVSPWKQSLYPISGIDWKDEKAWRAMADAPPPEARTTSGLCLARGLTVPPGPRGRTEYFGVVATTALDLPPGPYRFLVTSDDGLRLSLDGRPFFAEWHARGPTTNQAAVVLGARRQTFRVDYFQLEQGFVLWVRAEPHTGAAALFTAKLKGQDAGTARREAAFFARRFERQKKFADAASHYRLVGEMDDVIANRQPDEPTQKRRSEAAALTRQGKHAEAAAFYRELITAD